MLRGWARRFGRVETIGGLQGERKVDFHKQAESAREGFIEGRVYADGLVGIFMSIRADAAMETLRYECRTGDAGLIGAFDNLNAAISFAHDYGDERARRAQEDTPND